MIKAKRTYLATGAQRPGLGRGVSRTYAGAQRDARRAVREVREPYVGLVLSGKDADERGWKFWLETRKAARNHKPSPLSSLPLPLHSLPYTSRRILQAMTPTSTVRYTTVAVVPAHQVASQAITGATRAAPPPGPLAGRAHP
jgi:hypothetical protein